MHSLITIRHLDVYTLPLAQPVMNGGRIMTPAGEIAQVVGNQAFRYMAVLEFAENAIGTPRGNHYHLAKQETLYIIRGKVQAVFEDIANGERMEAELVAGDMVTIIPQCAHVLVAREYTLAIEFAPTPYDPDDTYRYEIQC